jgi:hypothetical protein
VVQNAVQRSHDTVGLSEARRGIQEAAMPRDPDRDFIIQETERRIAELQAEFPDDPRVQGRVEGLRDEVSQRRDWLKVEGEGRYRPDYSGDGPVNPDAIRELVARSGDIRAINYDRRGGLRIDQVRNGKSVRVGVDVTIPPGTNRTGEPNRFGGEPEVIISAFEYKGELEHNPSVAMPFGDPVFDRGRPEGSYVRRGKITMRHGANGVTIDQGNSSLWADLYGEAGAGGLVDTASRAMELQAAITKTLPVGDPEHKQWKEFFPKMSLPESVSLWQVYNGRGEQKDIPPAAYGAGIIIDTLRDAQGKLAQTPQH